MQLKLKIQNTFKVSKSIRYTTKNNKKLSKMSNKRIK